MYQTKKIIFISIIILTASINFNVPKDSIFWLLIISGVLLFTIERENISSQTSFFTQSTGDDGASFRAINRLNGYIFLP